MSVRYDSIWKVISHLLIGHVKILYVGKFYCIWTIHVTDLESKMPFNFWTKIRNSGHSDTVAGLFILALTLLFLSPFNSGYWSRILLSKSSLLPLLATLLRYVPKFYFDYLHICNDVRCTFCDVVQAFT